MLATSEESRQLDRLGKILGAYHKASGRTLAFAMIKTGRELAFALHKETVKITPTAARIEQDVSNVGWGMRPRPRSKGTEGSHHVRSALVKYRGVQGMIAARILHRKFAASGWLPAIRAFVAPNTVTTIHRKLGACEAKVEIDQGTTHIVLINYAGPIRKVCDAHGILPKAVNTVRRGMLPYIKRKLGDEARAAFAKL